MARYRRWGRARYRPNPGRDRALQHMIERRELSSVVGGIDDDVLRIFFTLGPNALESLLQKYEHQHGRAAGSYAREAYPRWKKGTTKVSGQTAERLINLVPEFLTHDQRYDLLRKLYERHRSTKSLSAELVLGQDNSTVLRQIDSFVSDVCAAPQLQTLPDRVAERIRWVCNQDVLAARKLMAAFETEESVQIATLGRLELAALISAVERIDAAASGYKTIQFPHGFLTVDVRKKPSGIGCLLLLLGILPFLVLAVSRT